MNLSCFMRYSTNGHKAELREWPGAVLNPIIFRETYEEASRAAKEWCALYAEGFGIEPEWIHHPHFPVDQVEDDPYAWVGSWGWKIELRASATDTQSEGEK